MTTYLDYLMNSLLPLGIAGINGITGYNASQDRERNIERQSLYRQVAQLVDTNHDGRVSVDEWNVVYNKLGIETDFKPARELDASELERVIQAK
jgi:hypothetical protein